MTHRTEVGPSPAEQLISAIEALTLEERKTLVDEITDAGMYAQFDGHPREGAVWSAILRFVSSVHPALGEQLAIAPPAER